LYQLILPLPPAPLEVKEYHHTKYFKEGGELGDWVNYDKEHLINTQTGMIVSKGTNLNAFLVWMLLAQSVDYP
jgi:hypothetical protein